MSTLLRFPSVRALTRLIAKTGLKPTWRDFPSCDFFPHYYTALHSRHSFRLQFTDRCFSCAKKYKYSTDAQKSFAMEDASLPSDMEENLANLTNGCNGTLCISDEDYMGHIEAYIFPTSFEWLLIVMSAIIFFFGTTGNVLVIVSVLRNPSMRSVTNHFIVNLALADCLVLIICLPPTILWDVTETWWLGGFMCRAVLFCQRVCVFVSVLTFFCIAVDRWHAIVQPLKFASTAARAKIAVLLTWLVAIIVSLPELVYLDIKQTFLPFPSIYFTQCVAHWDDTQETAYQLIIFYSFYIVPIFIMIGLYGQIVYTLWWRALPQAGIPPTSDISYSCSRQGSVALHIRSHTCLNVISNNNPNGYSASPNLSTRSPSAMSRSIPSYNQNLLDHQIRSRRRVAMMLIITVALFAFCYLPVHTFNILRSTVGLPNTQVWITMSLVVHWICYMQNASNPIIYYVMSEKFRREFNRIFKCCVRPVSRLRRNSSEVFRCRRPPGQTYYHTLGLPNRAEYSSSIRFDQTLSPPNLVVQL